MTSSLSDLKAFVDLHDNLQGQSWSIGEGQTITCLLAFYTSHIAYCENFGKKPIARPYWARLQKVHNQITNPQHELQDDTRPDRQHIAA